MLACAHSESVGGDVRVQGERERETESRAFQTEGLCGGVLGLEPLTGESAISVPDAGSSIWDAMAGLVRGQNGQHP